MAETSEERFKRVAGKRVKRILKQLELLANCSNKHNYQFSEEQVNKIFASIDAQAKEARAKFSISRSDNFAL